MRLRKIRLAGFKSFVDPTSIDLPGNLIGIVGPNGCGKSNIIDAVRWVLGEISAKHLRGDTMADVVFTGSNTRKPVGQATVELVFDNSDGRLGGRFAAYSEIAVKRTVSRESQSSYFLNGTRCRRRDVMDIFFGTGLGPRSYGIIEQGMISRIIEARPEELREFLEEAAGISKYKERRRETENRIRHTRENLDRLNDIRDELAKRLKHLKRQATMAEKYKVLKQEERDVRAQLLALRWRALDGEAARHDERVRGQETALEATLAAQRRVESELEAQRSAHVVASDAFNECYRQTMDAGAGIARREEAIAGLRNRREGLRESLGHEQQSLAAARAHVDHEERQRVELASALERSLPELEALQESAARVRIEFRDSEEAMHAWQSEFEALSERAREPAQVAHAEQARIQHLEQSIDQLESRRLKLDEEQDGLVVDALDDEVARLRTELLESEDSLAKREAQLTELRAQVREHSERQHETNAELDQARARLQTLRGRLASLEALQQDALGKGPGALTKWLGDSGLGRHSRLAEELAVESGWEAAVEQVLGSRLEGVCVDGLEEGASALDTFAGGALVLLDRTAGAIAAPEPPEGAVPLRDKVRAAWPLDSLLHGVYCADSLASALTRRSRLPAGESLVTPDGIWLGRDWLQVTRAAGDATGVLAREQEIKTLAAEREQVAADVAAWEARLQAGRERLREAEDEAAEVQARLSDEHHGYAARRSDVGAREARLDQVRDRARSIRAGLADIESRCATEQRMLEVARERHLRSSRESERISAERETWESQRRLCRERFEHAHERWQGAHDDAHERGLQVESMRTRLKSLEEARERNRQQVEGMVSRCTELRSAVDGVDAPLAEAESALATDLQARSAFDRTLKEARARVESLDAAVRELEQRRHAEEAGVQAERSKLEQLRLEGREFRVRRDAIEEQIASLRYALDELMEVLPADARAAEWEGNIETLARKITRLGPINLAAIDEHEQHAERKHYLDAQFEDLEEALETLQGAIQKIDRETRTRFRETYERVNDGLGKLFPQLFGGGNASLELTGEDLLSTGVVVMARPPGKRNTSIHLLSGGEKALTAVALVFSLFDLNPAPFCLLDEVDAPLDDANVERFCALVKSMSERVQLVLVTHNKITMEITQQLIGVTMNEPGVSRLVAVDVDEAVEMVAV